MRAVKDIGFKIGLHTAGIFPDRLEEILPLVDWVGLDVKAPWDERHDRITQKNSSFEAPAESLRLLLASGVAYELRTTVHPDLVTPEDLSEIARRLESIGATPTKIQRFRAEGCLDHGLVTDGSQRL